MTFAETKPLVLVVEDDEGVAVLERRSLERRGFCVRHVAGGAEAIEVLRSEPVDLIVTDYRLSDTSNGLDLLAELKAMGCETPVVMVTGFSNEKTAIEALRQGVRDFVPKTTEYLDYLPVAVERILQTVRTERRLSESEARFQSFMDNSPAVASIKNAAGRLLYANRRFAEECGRTDWLEKSDAELWPGETAEQLRSNDAAMLAAGTPQQMTEILTGPDGIRREWLSCRFPLTDAAGGSLIGMVAVDVSQQRLAEEALRVRDQQLQQSQKMEAIGQLAGGVAHDFNNLLTIILGYSAMLASGEECPTVNRREMIDEIHKAAERAANLTRQLLAFGRKQILAPRVLNLNVVLGDMQKMLRRLIGEDIQFHAKLDEHLAPVSADPGQIEQIIMNLVVNARDAMPHGGDLSIETANVELDAVAAGRHAEVKAGRYVTIAVSDNGCGMDSETRNRIFEPFFTTKEPGKGTGLGLSTVYGIVRQSGGHIWVYSEPGQGSTFKIYLPMESPPSKAPEAKQKIVPTQGKETILLVEDDEAVRAIAQSILELYGYTVLVAPDPTIAVKICEEYADEIDLLLTDVVMPHFNGRRLADLLLPRRPRMKVVYMSGYTDDTIARQGILDASVNYVQKPFTPAALAAKVGAVIAGGR